MYIGSNRFHPDGSVFNPTEAEVSALRNNTDYVAVYGYTTYIDNFGPHWVRFCDWWYYPGQANAFQPTYNASSCTSYNTVGDGDYPTRVTP